MRIDIYIHNDDSKLDLIIHKLNKIMSSIQAIQDQNTALIAAVAAEDTVIDSAVTLITGFGATLTALQTQLAEAIANGVDPAAVQAVADSLAGTIADVDAKKQALAEAVAATPAG